MPSNEFSVLETNSAQVPAFFDRYFPGVTSLIAPEELVSSFRANPHLPLISIKCEPYHFSDAVVIVGDAAHAMVPFYGQGMNAGLEDIRILFSILDKHATTEMNNPNRTEGIDVNFQRATALNEYSALRVADAHAINDLALRNYIEMRSSVLSPVYRVRKFVEEFLSAHVPSSGWQTQYSRVSFGNERYSEVVARNERQGKVLTRALLALSVSPLVLGSLGVALADHRSGGIRRRFQLIRDMMARAMRS